MRQEGPGAMGHAPKIDVHDPLEVIVRHLAHGRRQCNSSVVYHQVHLAEIPGDLLSMSVDGIPV